MRRADLMDWLSYVVFVAAFAGVIVTAAWVRS